METWRITDAQEAVNIVAAVMAGKPRDEIEVELCHWLDRRGTTLPEPHYSLVVEAVALGCRAVTLAPLVPGGECDRHPEVSATTGDSPQYVFLDGPLAGQSLSSPDAHLDGDRIDVGVVDVFQSVDEAPSYLYAVDAQARSGNPGRLRYVRTQPPHHRTRVPA